VTPKPVILRAAARCDVDEAGARYQEEGGADVALGFIDALEAAIHHIGLTPETGSPRYGHELHLAGLRSWALKRYPYLVFYLMGAEHIDVWRILDDRRDIAVWMRRDL
jgi:toxin ParE1/3/4